MKLEFLLEQIGGGRRQRQETVPSCEAGPEEGNGERDARHRRHEHHGCASEDIRETPNCRLHGRDRGGGVLNDHGLRSEEHTSELQSLMRISYAVFCLKKKNNPTNNTPHIVTLSL